MSDRYDVIVIGAGLGGLTCGALFAKDGRRVLVLERHAVPGGAATVFQRSALRVEVGLHQLDGFDEGDPKRWIVDRLELDAVKRVPLHDFFRVSHPLLGEDFVLPFAPKDAIAACDARFPQHKIAVRKYFETLQKLRKQQTPVVHNFDRPLWWLFNLPIFPLRFPHVMRFEHRTLADYLDELFGDDEAIKFALASNVTYYAGSPRRLAMGWFAAAQASYHLGGGSYIHGGSSELCKHLVGCIEAAGGSCLTRRTARELIVEGGRVVGVRHCKTTPAVTKKNRHAHAHPATDLAEARAPIVIGNAAPNVVGSLLPEPERQKFAQRYDGLQPSTSLWSIYLGLDAPPKQFGLHDHTVFVYPNWMQRLEQKGESAQLLAADPDPSRLPSFSITNYDNFDSGLCSGGRYLVVMTGTDALENWAGLSTPEYEARKAAWLRTMVGELERRYPGIGAAIRYQEMATARTMQRFLNTPVPYGFAHLPSQSGRHRPGPKTAVPGLWLASAFTRPGGGFTGTMLAGGAAYKASRSRLR